MTGTATGEAPGRLDVLGGVSDYSGGLVLQMPLAATTRVTLAASDEPAIRVSSCQAGASRSVVVPLPEWQGLRTAVDPAGFGRGWLDSHGVPGWARYPLGCLILFSHRFGWEPATGLAIEVRSDVPVSMGVSSSAALEVATLRALETFAGRRFAGTELARLAQRAENEIVAAPCGLMDQLASAHGLPGRLLPIECRPDRLREPVSLPPGVTVVGWPSGVAHAVSGSPYGVARTAAFMAKRILAGSLGRPLDYLSQLAPSIVASAPPAVLPDTLTGAEFVTRYGGVDDPLSQIDPRQAYPIRAAASFAVAETFRATVAEQLLRQGPQPGLAETVGELLAQSHLGYTAIGLGAPETDRMVEAVGALGATQGFYGARVSGGGCGGTVVVLLEEASLPTLEHLAASLTGTQIIR
jgi:galactokinase